MTATKLTVVNSLSGTMRVHRAGCADIARRELPRANGTFDVEADSTDEALRIIWADFLAEWDGDLSYGEAETEFLPCCGL